MNRQSYKHIVTVRIAIRHHEFFFFTEFDTHRTFHDARLSSPSLSGRVGPHVLHAFKLSSWEKSAEPGTQYSTVLTQDLSGREPGTIRYDLQYAPILAFSLFGNKL
jgi:hypothetical protein